MSDNLEVTYPAEAYNIVLKKVQTLFKLDNGSLTREMWIRWRSQIKQLFNDGLLVDEILAALEEAAENKKNWPTGTAFWWRVRDVALLKKRDRPKPLVVNEGPKAIGSLFDDIKDRFITK